jgi:hypothetical protein
MVYDDNDAARPSSGICGSTGVLLRIIAMERELDRRKVKRRRERRSGLHGPLLIRGDDGCRTGMAQSLGERLGPLAAPGA